MNLQDKTPSFFLATCVLGLFSSGCVIEVPMEGETDTDATTTDDSATGDPTTDATTIGDPTTGDPSGDSSGDTTDGGPAICPGSEGLCTDAESHCDDEGLLQICQYSEEDDCIFHAAADCADVVGAGSVCEVVDPTLAGCTEAAPVPDPDAWYRLKTDFKGDGKCLEGNEAGSPVHSGNAFMNDCQDVSGQLWRFVPEMVGMETWYRMKTQFQGDDKCLEGNDASSPFHDGGAFMDDCQDASGQLWRLTPDGDWYRFGTMFQGEGKCLEGNQAASPVHDGSAFLDDCQEVTGQLWVLEEAV